VNDTKVFRLSSVQLTCLLTTAQPFCIAAGCLYLPECSAAFSAAEQVKGKIHRRTGHEGPEGEERCSTTLSLTSALDVVGGQRHAPAALPPGKTPYPLCRRLDVPQGRSGRVRKISPPPPGFDPPTVQPVASRYTD
jgi:hypothetical protein